MTKRLCGRAVVLVGAVAVFCSMLAIAQEEKGDWPLTGGNPGQNDWQKNESILAPDSIAGNFKFLWKIKLGEAIKGARSFSEPLLAGRLINAQGFKDIVYWSSADTVYAVDSELGTLIWKKQFSVPAGRPKPGCGVSSLGMLMEPPLVINFHARRKRPPGTPRPPEAPPAPPTERRLGVAPGGGYFGLKGIYVLTPDGMLHEQVMTTGADFASSVKFLPAGNGSAYGLNFADKTIYTATGRGCGRVPDGLWAIDLASADYPVASITRQARPLALTGPVLASDGTAFFVTGNGNSKTANEEVHAGSVVSVTKEMKVEDWYTPSEKMATYTAVSPILFTYKEKPMVVAPGKSGGIALLDSASLGGADHHTALFETAPISRPEEKHGWDGFATWQDKDGTTWVFASVSAGVTLSESNVKLNGATPHGAIVGFMVEDTNGKLSLNPAWVSQDMVNPAPPVIANGVVIGLSDGDASHHAKLYVLNAANGAELFSSKDQIPTDAPLSGVSVGDGHAFFTDRDNVLYSFGIGMEH